MVEAIKNGRHKVIVCVDMFGEGFDLPALKIAALHTVHKSLGVTLQFIGRFARTAAGVGPAIIGLNHRQQECRLSEAILELRWKLAKKLSGPGARLFEQETWEFGFVVFCTGIE